MSDERDVPIFYINLANRPDRRERMERIFAERGLSATRIEACTPDTIPPEYREIYEKADRAKRLADVEMASLSSHLLAMRAIVESGAPAGVVLEDDVRIARAFGRQVRDLAERADFDVVRLETFQETVRLAKPARPLSDGFMLYGMAEYDGCCAGYMLTRDGARRYLAMPVDPTLPTDDWLFDMQRPKPPKLRAFQMVPAVVIQFWHRSPDGEAEMDTDLSRARAQRFEEQGKSFPRFSSVRLLREVQRIGYRLRRAIERFRHGNPVFYRSAKPHNAFADDLFADGSGEPLETNVRETADAA